MLINLRNALMAGKRTPTAKDYVQDGLVAMWDGIENAGWGVHDNTATSWRDLIGDNDLILNSNAYWGKDCLSCDVSTNGFAFKNTTLADSMQTIEVGWQRATSTGPVVIFSCGATSNTSFKRGFVSHYRDNTISGSAYNIDGPIARSKSVIAKCAATFVFPDKAGFLPDAAYLYGIRSQEKAHDTWGNSTKLGFSPYINNQYSFIGNAYYARIYSRALTADEVAANYAIDKARFNLP